MTPPLRLSLNAVLLTAGIVGGLALRAWVLASDSLGSLNADEAVVGLVARHFLAGEWSTFFWGQTYGGTLEPLVVAAAFAAAGSGTLVLKLVSVALFAVAAGLVWVVGRRTVGDRAAAIAVVLFAIWPPYVVWWSTKQHGFYNVLLVLGLLVVLAALRLRERRSVRDYVLLGGAAGLGWWTTPMIAFVAVPAAGWLVLRRPRALREGWPAAAAFAAGAAPWLAWSLRYDWATFDVGPEPGGDGYADRLHVFAASVLPMALGLREPFTLEWIAGAAAGRAVELALFGLLAWTLVRRRGGQREVLVAWAAAYPFLFALSPYAAMTTEPRYLYLAAPPIALLLGSVLAHRTALTAAGCIAAATLTIVGLDRLEHTQLADPVAHGGRVPSDIRPALRVLEEHGARRVRASYWIAYRITFESQERIVAASTDQVRYEPFQRLVRGERAPLVYVADADDEKAARRSLLRRDFERIGTGGWAVYLP